MRSLSGGNEQEEGEMKNFRFVRKRKTQSASTSTSVDLSLAGASVFFDGTRVDLLTTALPLIKASMSADTEPITQMVASNTPGPLFMEVLFFFPFSLFAICAQTTAQTQGAAASSRPPA